MGLPIFLFLCICKFFKMGLPCTRSLQKYAVREVGGVECRFRENEGGMVAFTAKNALYLRVF